MKYALALIDKAAEVCGGYSALADRMGIPVQNVSLMKSGKRAIYIVCTGIERKLRALIGAVCSQARILSRSWLAPDGMGSSMIDG